MGARLSLKDGMGAHCLIQKGVLDAMLASLPGLACHQDVMDAHPLILKAGLDGYHLSLKGGLDGHHLSQLDELGAHWLSLKGEWVGQLC